MILKNKFNYKMGLSFSCMEVITNAMQPTLIREEYPDGKIVTIKQYNPWLSSVGCISVTIILLALLRPKDTYKTIDRIQNKF